MCFLKVQHMPGALWVVNECSTKEWVDGQMLSTEGHHWSPDCLISLLQIFLQCNLLNFLPSTSYPFLECIFSFGSQNWMQFWCNHNPSKHLFLYPILLLIPFPGDNCGHLKAQTWDSFLYFLPSSTWIIVTASTLTIMLITPKSVALTSHLSSYPLSLCAYHWRLLPGFLTTKYPNLLRFLSMKEVCVCVCVCKYGVVCILLALGTTANSNDNNSYHILIIYYMSGTLYLSAHLIFTTTLQSRN